MMTEESKPNVADPEKIASKCGLCGAPVFLAFVPTGKKDELFKGPWAFDKMSIIGFQVSESYKQNMAMPIRLEFYSLHHCTSSETKEEDT